jgi:predicted nucleic-acid-binding Zn-ribbon protein
MKTALQQAFARLEELHPSLFDIHTEKGRTFVNEFSKFLEVEREQIIDACKQCSYSYEEAEQYYNETFKSE